MLLFSFLLIAMSWNLHKLLKLTSSFNFEHNWFIRLDLLWINSYVNEQKCKQWRHNEPGYTLKTAYKACRMCICRSYCLWRWKVHKSNNCVSAVSWLQLQSDKVFGSYSFFVCLFVWFLKQWKEQWKAGWNWARSRFFILFFLDMLTDPFISQII